MLDDHEGVARLGQPGQHADQLLHVGDVQSRGGLVQHVDGAPRGLPGQLGGQFDALGLAAGEGGGGLAQLHVAQAHVPHGLQLAADLEDGVEELQRFVHGHLEDLVDVLPLVAHLEGLAVVAMALADLAGHVHVGQEVHLDLDDAVAGARLAAPALDVEGKAVGLVAPGLGVGRLGEHVADHVEQAGVGGRVRARRAADGGLVNGDDLVQLLHAVDAVVGARPQPRAVQRVGQGLVEYLVDQRRLAAAGNAGDAGDHAQREGHVDALEIMRPRAAHGQPAGGLPAL